MGRGLSPPTRGNLTSADDDKVLERSIPAHAGEPLAALSASRGSRVYPRPRGGTPSEGWGAWATGGLSPPTRGNLLGWSEQQMMRGSIPAHAGEPSATRRGTKLIRVYPRPRGGTRATGDYSARDAGLSPPTRGNHERPRESIRRRRSIPAHAGEPLRASTRSRISAVYPRPRGGTKIEIAR